MIRARSLRLRLLLGAAVLIVVAVGVTGVALSALFRDQVRAQYETELLSHLNQLTSLLEFDDQGRSAWRASQATPFQPPYGGRYWQIERAAQPALRSRSLWDQALALPNEVRRRVDWTTMMDVPGIGEACSSSGWCGSARPADDPIRIAVALPIAEIDAVTARFDRAARPGADDTFGRLDRRFAVCRWPSA